MCESKRHFSCHDAPALRQPPQVFHSAVIVSSEPRGAADGRVKANPLSPHSTFQPCHWCQPGGAGMKGETLGGETQAVAPPPTPESHFLVCAPSGITLHFSSGRTGSERGGIGHESSHNPRWWAEALAFKKKTPQVTPQVPCGPDWYTAGR